MNGTTLVGAEAPRRINRVLLDACDGGLTLAAFKIAPVCEVELLGWFEDPRGAVRAFWRRLGDRGDEVWQSAPLDLEVSAFADAMLNAMVEMAAARAVCGPLDSEGVFRLHAGWLSYGGDRDTATAIAQLLFLCDSLSLDGPSARVAPEAGGYRLRRFETAWVGVDGRPPITLRALRLWFERWGLPLNAARGRTVTL